MTPTTKKRKATRGRATRMNPLEREQMIVRKAVEYFAEYGFDGSTRDLAEHIGVTQSLLYRYFPNKQALIDRVYNEVYLARWNPLWEDALQDRTHSLEYRLKDYYLQYAQNLIRNDWVRILIFAGLRKKGIDDKFFEFLKKRVFSTVVEEARHEFAFSPVQEGEDINLEIELVWALHASIFYIGMRRWVYDTAIPKNFNQVIEHLVEGLIHTFANLYRKRSQADAQDLPSASPV